MEGKQQETKATTLKVWQGGSMAIEIEDEALGLVSGSRISGKIVIN